jgi:peroxiredoxin family protein
MDGRRTSTLESPILNRPEAKVAVFLHDGGYDRMHQGLSIAAAAAASERPVDVYLFWWALDRLVRDVLDDPDFGPAPEREAAAMRFEQRGAPTLRALLMHLKEARSCTLYACTGSMAIVGAQPEGIEKWSVRFVGWNSILQLTQGVHDRFYL